VKDEDETKHPESREVSSSVSPLASLVARARRRLARAASRRLLSRRGWWIVGIAAVAGCARPLLWPIGDADPLWIGVPRALGFALGSLAFGLLALAALGRRRPDGLRAARQLDAALGLREVLASGHALGGESVAEQLARARAEEVARGVNLRATLPLPSLRPRLRSVALTLLLVVIASAVGGYEAALLDVLTSPPTVAELESAAELEDAAAALAEEIAAAEETEELTPESGEVESGEDPLVREAAGIAADLRRGRREQALERLQDLRRAGEERTRDGEALDAAMRELARHLETRRRGAEGEGQGREGQGREGQGREGQGRAEDQMRLLARRMREQGAGQSAEERERTLERLSRAADRARRQAERGERGSEGMRRMAEALHRAADALTERRAEDAARALEQAAQRAAQLQRERAAARREAEALARLLERAGLVERDVQLAMLGRDGGERPEGQQGEGQQGHGQQGDGQQGEGAARRGLAEGLAARLAALGLAEGPRRAGNGRGGRDDGRPGPRRPGPRRDPLDTQGDLHAASTVREGERAVQVLQGMGRNGAAEEGYEDLYPSYGAIAEDALASEDVPLARRDAVRRYFERIRPGHTDEDDDTQQRGAGDE